MIETESAGARIQWKFIRFKCQPPTISQSVSHPPVTTKPPTHIHIVYSYTHLPYVRCLLSPGLSFWSRNLCVPPALFHFHSLRPLGWWSMWCLVRRGTGASYRVWVSCPIMKWFLLTLRRFAWAVISCSGCSGGTNLELRLEAEWDGTSFCLLLSFGSVVHH